MVDGLNGDNLDAVPLFPLPNVVLFPRAIVPLHIFEERYKTMTADALAGDRLMALALLRPGWEKDYYQRPPIEPVVCVGRILSHEVLPDGKYNFLLQGLMRATIAREVSKEPYRVARLQPFESLPCAPSELAAYRKKMEKLLQDKPWSHLPAARQFLQMLASDLSTEDILDLLAFTFLEDVPLKQSLLADADISNRAAKIVHAIEALRPVFPISSGPNLGSADNPSMN